MHGQALPILLNLVCGGGDAAFETALAAGQALTLDQAAAEASPWLNRSRYDHQQIISFFLWCETLVYLVASYRLCSSKYAMMQALTS
jgi:hypothetical protein